MNVKEGDDWYGKYNDEPDGEEEHEQPYSRKENMTRNLIKTRTNKKIQSTTRIQGKTMENIAKKKNVTRCTTMEKNAT